MADLREQVAKAIYEKEAELLGADPESFDVLVKRYLPTADEYRSIADAAITAGAGVRVKQLEWDGPYKAGKFYASFSIGAGFGGYYTIEQREYGLASVKFGVHCHKLGAAEIWKGPSEEAKAAAQADYERRILSALEPINSEGE